MRIERTSSHTRYDLKAHIIFIPKARKRVLRGEVGTYIAKTITQICTELDIEIISGKMAIDHVHLFISYPTKWSMSEIAQKIKGKSSYKALNYYPHLKKGFWGRHFWSRGYYVVSSGNITDEMIQKYIEEQSGQDIQQGDIEVAG